MSAADVVGFQVVFSWHSKRSQYMADLVLKDSFVYADNEENNTPGVNDFL